MSYKDVESLIYNKLEYAVGAVVKFKDTQGITQPKGTLKIRTLFPPDMVMIVEEGTSWTSVCSLDAIHVIGKPAERSLDQLFTETNEPDEEIVHNVVTTPTSSTACINCGRTLTAPRSVACGYGPKCYRDLFGTPQPRITPRRSRGVRTSSRKVSEIDYSKLSDARKWFE